jgi:5,10-methylenetetrahydrofolate reductase
MSESESEDEILDRIEAALRRIAVAGVNVPAGPGTEQTGDDALDRALLKEALDEVIAKLRAGLEIGHYPKAE